MTVQIPAQMEAILTKRADRLHLSVESLVEQALNWYVHIDPDVLEEFAEIEDAHAEALWLVEDSVQ